uniref:CHK domain-containing protein n=1 Tax=Strongyloides papillosus TaxID=174720 RepID=A0A0N5CH99_STREA
MTAPEFFCEEDYGSKYFIGGKITHQWIVDCLEKNDADFRKHKGDSKVKEINGIDISDGKGFTSKVFKTSIYFDDEKKAPYYVILKIPGDESFKESMKKQNIDDTLNMELDKISPFHNKECHFYNYVASKIKDLKYPECYGSKDIIVGKQTGALIMKFLGSDSVTVPFYRSLNIYQTKSVLDEAFKLQEYSLLNQDDFISNSWEQPFSEEIMKSFLDYIKKGMPTVKKYIPKEMWSEIEDDLDKMVSNYTKIIKHVFIELPYIPKEMWSEIEDDLDKMVSNYTKIIKHVNLELPKSNGNVTVISHGDMWTNNFMFKLDSNGNCSNDLSAVFDWQTVFKGTTGHDISRILAVSAPPDVRREIEKEYLPDFYERLKESLIKSGKEMKISYETFMNNYKLCFIEQSLMMFLMIGFALQEYNVPEEPDYIWDARKFNIGSKVWYNIYDAIKFCKELHPEWLENSE